VNTAGIGVLCQLECEGEFRAEVLRWIPGYNDPSPAASLTGDSVEASESVEAADSVEAGRSVEAGQQGHQP
jgi:hypothetical protein